MQFVAVGLFLIKGGFGFERGETGGFAMRFAAFSLWKRPRNQRFWPRNSRQIEWAPRDGAKFYSTKRGLCLSCRRGRAGGRRFMPPV